MPCQLCCSSGKLPDSILWWNLSAGSLILILRISLIRHDMIYLRYGSFTLLEMDSDTDSDSDYKPNGYTALCRTCSHCTDSDSDPYSLLPKNPYSLLPKTKSNSHCYYCTGWESESVPKSVSSMIHYIGNKRKKCVW